MPIFTAISYWIEIFASWKTNRILVFVMIFINQAVLLIFPLLISFKFDTSYLIGLMLMLYATTTSLKLISFHHTMHDCRGLVLRVIKAKKDGITMEPSKVEGTILGMPKVTYDEACTYPKCLNVSHFFRFMLAPTMCF